MRTKRLAAAAGAAALVLAACNGDTSEPDAPAEEETQAVEDTEADGEEDTDAEGDADSEADADADSEADADADSEADADTDGDPGQDDTAEDATEEDAAAAADGQNGFDPDETISLREFVASVGGDDDEEFPFETLPEDIDLELPAAHNLEMFQGPQQGQWVADSEGEERSGLLAVNVPDAELDALLAFFDEQLAAYGWEETDVETNYTRSVPLSDDFAPSSGDGGDWFADAEMRLNIGEDDDLPFERTFINLRLAVTPTVR